MHNITQIPEELFRHLMRQKMENESVYRTLKSLKYYTIIRLFTSVYIIIMLI